MSEVHGALLKDIRNYMTASQHIKCIRSIANLIKQPCAVRVPYCGYIYHTCEAVKGGVHVHERYVIDLFAPKHQRVRESFQMSEDVILDPDLVGFNFDHDG